MDKNGVVTATLQLSLSVTKRTFKDYIFKMSSCTLKLKVRRNI